MLTYSAITALCIVSSIALPARSSAGICLDGFDQMGTKGGEAAKWHRLPAILMAENRF